MIVSLESWGENQTLINKLSEFYQGKNWQNTYIFILPNIDSILSSYEIIEKQEDFWQQRVCKDKWRIKKEKFKN